jgi:hypothetical protein
LTWSILSDDDYNDDRGHDGNGDDDNNDDDNGDDWNDDRGGSDDDDDNGGSSGGGGDDTLSGATFVNALNAAMSSSVLPVLEAEAEREGATDYLEVLQWNNATGQLTRLLVNASTLEFDGSIMGGGAPKAGGGGPLGGGGPMGGGPIPRGGPCRATEVDVEVVASEGHGRKREKVRGRGECVR